MTQTNRTAKAAFWAVWDTFSDVHINDNEETEVAFRHFPAGTNRFDIWAWFESEFCVTLGRELGVQT